MRIAPRPRCHPALQCTFWCHDCGRVRTILGRDAPFGDGVCLACIFHPGWFRDPELRAAIDPDHDGLDCHEREALGDVDQREAREPDRQQERRQ